MAQGDQEILRALEKLFQQSMEDLPARMDTAEADIDVLQADVTQAQADIDALEGDVAAAEADIDALQIKAKSHEVLLWLSM